MSIRKKLIVLLFSVMAIALIALCGCMGELGPEEYLSGESAWNQYVMYYGNGGTFNSTNDQLVKRIHYKPGVEIIGNDTEVRGFSVARDDYTFGGWYYVQLGADGTPVFDENGGVTLTDPVSFPKTIKENEKLYFGALWIPKVKLDIRLVTDDGGSFTVASTVEGEQVITTYNPGDTLTLRSFIKGYAQIERRAPVTPQNKEYTFTQFFYDEACTQRVISNIPVPENDGSAVNPVIYAQYVKGDWTIVENADGVQDMLSGSGKYWIANMSENKVIDCSKITRSLRRSEWPKTIEGNGYTLKGINTGLVAVKISTANESYSLFGQFTENTVIKNLTFEDLKVNVNNDKQNVSIFLLSNGVSGATLENVTLKNVSLEILSANQSVVNIPKTASGYITNNWLFGGLGTDSAFLEAYNGVKVDGAKLTINDTVYNFGE